MLKNLNKNYTILTLILSFALYLGLNLHKDLLIAQSVEERKEITQQDEKKEEISKNPQETSEISNVEKSITTIWSLFLAGGPFMWPLLLASIVGLAIILERLFYFSFHKFTKKTLEQDIIDRLNSGINDVIEYFEKYKNYLISKITKEALDISEYDPDKFMKAVEREAMIYFTQAERGLSILAAISTIAPLIGFLGTVSGMINAFDAIANADTVNAKIVAAGIKEALITTATGLIVAVPVMAMFQYFQNKVNTFSAEVETVANHIYKELLRIQVQTEKSINEKITAN